jgi:hypothetical protein
LARLEECGRYSKSGSDDNENAGELHFHDEMVALSGLDVEDAFLSVAVELRRF